MARLTRQAGDHVDDGHRIAVMRLARPIAATTARTAMRLGTHARKGWASAVTTARTGAVGGGPPLDCPRNDKTQTAKHCTQVPGDATCGAPRPGLNQNPARSAF